MGLVRGFLIGLGLLVAAPTSAHASTIYVTEYGSTVSTVDTVSGHRGTAAYTGLGSISGDLALTPDGRTVYVAGSQVRAVDTTTNIAGPALALPEKPNALAVTPDGTTLLVMTESAVTPVATANQQPGAPISLNGPTDLAVAPNGRTAYVLTASGTLTPVDLTTNTTGTPIALAHPGQSIEITPDGALAVIAETEGTSPNFNGFVQVVDLATGTPEAPVAVADQPAKQVVVAPDGSTAYVLGGQVGLFPIIRSAVVFPFDLATRKVGESVSFTGSVYGPRDIGVSADGVHLYALLSCRSVGCNSSTVVDQNTTTGSVRYLPVTDPYGQSVSPSAMLVAPSPAATFTFAPGTTSKPTSFDAVDANNVGGSITNYAWDFGDGTTATGGAASVTHVYSNPGTYTVKLTTTNSGGCADRVVYTGKSALCTGSATATTTRTLAVITPGATARTGPATARKTTSAMLTGTVGETGAEVDWHFEYGTSTRYGQATPAIRGTGPVARTVGKLKPNTTYHYRLVAATDRGTPPVNSGADVAFKTATTGTLRLQAKTLRLRGKWVNVALRCVSSIGCRGSLKLTSGKRTCATGPFRLKANQRTHKRLTVHSTCRKKRSARLTSTVNTGQRDIATTVRIKR
jgi:hypothetical protein